MQVLTGMEASMRTVKFEHLRPGEILEEQKRKSIVYLPIGPLEWHGPAMPYGTDPLGAEYVALKAAQMTGGVVMPTLYIGTERERTPEILDAMGFEDVCQYIVGQDFPANDMKSLYFKEDVFCMILRAYLDLLVRQKYRLIVIVNGHGAENQNYAMNRMCTEYSHETDSKVIYVSSFVMPDGLTKELGHGNCAECSMAMFLHEEDVDLSAYPVQEKRLRSNAWGINDIFTYRLKPNEDKTVQGDPRSATVEIGKRYLEAAVREVSEVVNQEYEKID